MTPRKSPSSLPAGQAVGYVRVSSADQKTDRQLDRIKLHKIFEDKASAGDLARPQLQACLEYVREGDTLHVHSIDRLARNLQDLLQLLETLTGKGVTVQFHKEGLTFTGQDNPFQKLHFQIIGAVAEFERALIRERQREGIAKAKAQGRPLGRPAKVSPEAAKAAMERIQAGESKAAVAKDLGVSRETLYSALRRLV